MSIILHKLEILHFWGAIRLCTMDFSTNIRKLSEFINRRLFFLERDHHVVAQ